MVVDGNLTADINTHTLNYFLPS